MSEDTLLDWLFGKTKKKTGGLEYIINKLVFCLLEGLARLHSFYHRIVMPCRGGQELFSV
jgi:hypothetical protein